MQTAKLLLKDIRFWILLSLLIRLYGITNPPLEVAHNWRQTTVCMVARNFHETDPNILYPRIDFAGDKTGITGMEFPLLNYMIYMISELFGYSHWYGRLINLIISCLGIYFFYRLVKKYFGENTGFYAGLILLVSIWFSFSRKIMPDTFSMSLLITGIYYGTNYLDNHKHRITPLLLYFLFVTLAVLSKLPSAYLLVVFALFIFNKGLILSRRIIFISISVIALVPSYYWYFHWVPFLVDKYDFWHFFMGKSMLTGIQEVMKSMPKTLERFYETALKFIGFACFIFGIIQTIRLKKYNLLLLFAISFFSFLVIIFKAGYTFSHHTYYIIPFAPVMALVAGYGIHTIKMKTLTVILLILIATEGILNQNHDFFINGDNQAIEYLEKDMDQISQRDDLILINSGNYPTPMYFAHRKGWIAQNDSVANQEYIRNLKQKGLKYIVILKNTFGKNIELSYELIMQNDHYKVYKP